MIAVSVVSALVLPAVAEMSPAGETMLAVRAAKAVKKQKEKAEEEEAQKQKISKLQERYPQDVKAYESLLKNDPEAAKRKFAAMVTQYQKDTGEDLDKTYAVKKREGPLKRIKESVTGETESNSTESAGSETSGEKHRVGILNRLRGE